MREFAESLVLGAKFLIGPGEAFKNPATAMLWIGSWGLILVAAAGLTAAVIIVILIV